MLNSWNTIALFVLSSLSVQLAYAQCNGDQALCDKRFNEVAFLTTHNAFNAEEDNFNLPNQTYGLTRQLNDGVRALMLDVYDEGDVPTVYHSFSFLGTTPLESNLSEIKNFLDANPNEVVTIIFECYADFLMIEEAFVNTELLPYTYSQEQGEVWPTLQEMIDDNKRLLVLSDRDDAAPGESWYHYVWDYAVETDFSNNALTDFDCDFNRGEPENDLFILNHFATDPTLGTGRTDLSEQANEFDYFYNRSLQCWAEAGKFPNFPTVDFYELGDALEVVDSLNAQISVGITEKKSANPISVFPNPSAGIFQLNWERPINANVRVFSATGGMMLETRSSGDKLQLDISDYPEGVYYTVIQTAYSSENIRLIHLNR